MIFSENRRPPPDRVRGQAFPDHALLALQAPRQNLGARFHRPSRSTEGLYRIGGNHFAACRHVTSGWKSWPQFLCTNSIGLPSLGRAQRSPHAVSARMVGTRSSPASVKRYSYRIGLRLIGLSFDDAAADQRLKASRQQIARDAQILDQFVKAREAEEKIADDQRRPPVADQIEPAGQRTVHPGKTGSLHGAILASCMIELNAIWFNH